MPNDPSDCGCEGYDPKSGQDGILKNPDIPGSDADTLRLDTVTFRLRENEAEKTGVYAWYDRNAGWYDGYFHRPMDRAENALIRHVLHHAAPAQRGVVVDVGCGTGFVADLNVRGLRGHRLIGVDPSAGMLTLAYHKHPDGDWRQGTAERLPVESQSVVGYLSLFAMGYANLPMAMAELHRVCRPGASVCIITYAPGFQTSSSRVMQGTRRWFHRQRAEVWRAMLPRCRVRPLSVGFDHMPGWTPAPIFFLLGWAGLRTRRFTSARYLLITGTV